jgi:hypothetical protein
VWAQSKKENIMFEGQVEVNGKKFQIEIEWFGKRGTYN